MQVVWKEKLRGQLGEVLTIALPLGAEIVKTGISPADGEPSIWFTCNPCEERKKQRRFRVVFTGSEVEESATHIGMWWEGNYVFHLFEIDTL